MSKKRVKRVQTLVDICIPVYGRFDLLEKCLEAIPEAIKFIYLIMTAQ
jgi:hypothetical protein